MKKKLLTFDQKFFFQYILLRAIHFLLQLSKNLFGFNIWKIFTHLIETNNLLQLKNIFAWASYTWDYKSICLIQTNPLNETKNLKERKKFIF